MNGEGKLMKKIIKSIISNEAPKDNADKFIKCYEDLKEESNNFEDLVYDGKIKLNYVMPNMPGTLRYEIRYSWSA